MPAMISDPIEFELFKNSLFSIADEMALTIFRTTYSGVLKDNMDYSTAMFDGFGNLAAQGLTLPGHLGSMPTAMAAIRQAFAGRIEAGDVFILNDPFQGGMHLPDIFVFKPVFLDHIDDDGIDVGKPIPLRVTITKSSDHVSVDWSGSSPQVKGAINNTLSFTKSASYCAIRSVLPANIPNNDGVFRAIEVKAPQ